jgi:hypothetical protein
VHLVGFTTGIYYDAQTYERQTSLKLRKHTIDRTHIVHCSELKQCNKIPCQMFGMLGWFEKYLWYFLLHKNNARNEHIMTFGDLNNGIVTFYLFK